MTIRSSLALVVTGALAMTVAVAEPVRVEDFSWLVGHWRGEGFGGIIEEMWAPAAGGAMMGMFRHLKDGEPVFYELVLITKEKDELVMKVKHFTREFVAWEDKPDYVTFQLVEASAQEAHFKGLSIQRSGDTLEMALTLHGKDGVRVEKLVFQRVE